MGFHRLKRGGDPDDELAHLSAEENEVSSQIEEISQFLDEAPRQVREQQEERLTVMPPDDLDDRRRSNDFYGQLSRGELRNERRSQARNLLLLLLLIIATAAILMWVYRVVQGA